MKGYSAPPEFAAFLESGVDRFAYLKEYLEDRGCKPAVAALAGSRHLMVGKGAASGGRPRTVVVAHYDRAPFSPGANDNSAAVFQLIDAACEWRGDGRGAWLAVFTDREEAASTRGVKGQGAYALAEGFKNLGMANADFYILDACGRGDTLTVSTTVDGLLKAGGKTAAAGRIGRLRARAMAAARVGGLAFILAPTPFSDDVGFLAAGIAAQTITVLPANEADALLRSRRGRRDVELSFLRRSDGSPAATAADTPRLPATWRLLHNPEDDPASLNADAFGLMRRFLSELLV